MNALRAENLVIGGGVVGLSVAFGLLQAGHKVHVLDGADRDLRASHGNFGLTWLQGKGARYAPYSRWTWSAVQQWPAFAEELAEISGQEVALEQPGGFEFFTDSDEHQTFAADLAAQAKTLGHDFTYQSCDGDTLRRNIPGIGPDVTGATYCAHDGHVNPLKLLHALRLSVQRLGGTIQTNATVKDLKRDGAFYRGILADQSQIAADRVFLCAGLGASDLAPQLGFRTIVRPQRGELLITERLETRLPFLSSTIRQVDEGGVQIGGTKAEVGPDDAETLPKMRELARHAVAIWPALAEVNILRSWGALRVVTPDGYPVYGRAPDGGDAFLVTCHSGVTLSPVHAKQLVAWFDDHKDAPNLEGFRDDRF
ncbi:Glycine/D-amino acid oxidase [Shimia gijangensis]|uniref:Glycine/D-amino acid oxidase n=1 Tax=Shimia gijangensis TaxID=1470563 RepID=A0A1M6RZ11_9RHOB|nr:FAD-dependent oxidoreductase [Shimia gijangensis]SHK37539.1 Glycine/D-amino acid oxidase [Shimia gijangensis]